MRIHPKNLSLGCLGIAVGCCLLIALGWALTLERIGYERHEAIEGAVRQNSNLALAFEEHTIRTLKGIDRVVRYMSHEYRTHGAALDTGFVLEEGSLDSSAVTIAAIVDPRGELVAPVTGGAGVNVVDREYFEFHRDHPGEALRISKPVVGRVTGRYTIHLTRRIDRADGGFAGVALVGVDPAYFADFYNHVDLGARGLILLAGLDGRIRARRAGAELTAGHDLEGSALLTTLRENRAGSELWRDGLDGVERYVSHRQVDGFPLAVAVGTAKQDVLAEFSGRQRNYFAGASVATLFVLMFGALLLLARRRQKIELEGKLAAEARYRATFDHAAVGVSHAAPDGRFLRANATYCAMLGYTEAELLQRRFLDVIHEEDRGMADRLRAHFVSGDALSPAIEHREIRKDGSILWTSVAVSMVRDAAGRPEYFIAMVRDISKRRQAEEAVRESETRFRQLAENIREVFWLTDPSKNQMLYVSPGYEHIWGRSCEALYSSPREWARAIHPEDRERVLYAAQTRQASGDYVEEYRIVRPDGKVRWIRDRAFPVARNGEVYRIAGVAEDITERKSAELQLRESERRFRDMLGEVQLASLMLDCKARITYCNDYLLELTGWSREEVIGKDWFELFVPPEDADMKKVFRDLVADEPAAWHHENEILTHAGGRRLVRWNNTVLRSIEGEVIGVASIGEDITERHEAEARYRATFEQSATGIVHAGLDGKILTANRKFCRMLGYDERELVGRGVDEVTHLDDRSTSLAAARQLALHTEDSFVPEYEKRYVRKDGSALWVALSVCVVRDARGLPQYFIGLATDITARKEAEEKLFHQAHYDALTGLPNRVLCFDRLSQALAQAGRKQWSTGVLFMDLDRFKVVNDTLGHASGDAVLRMVAQRLAGCVRAGDTVARVGGDEFVVVLAELTSPQHGAVVAKKIVDAMAQPLRFEGQEIYISTSIGIATYPGDGADGDTLVKNADAAMLRAKESRNGYQFYTAAMNEQALKKAQLETDLRRALERNEFFLHYQPKVSLASGRITGVEALLRWNRPGHGAVSPAQFVPILEDCGLIVPVGDWIVDAACAQIRAWRDAGLDAVPVAVNLAAKQFLHHDIGAVIEAALRRHGIEPSLLEFEITESDVMRSPQEVAAVLQGIRAGGCTIAVDDFGTGYSSLAYLKRLPLDTLKIDRSFISGLPADLEDAAIARAVIAMARRLGLKVVAEGVETEEQRIFLAINKCDEMQGFLFSKPLPAEQCARMLAHPEALPAARPDAVAMCAERA